MKGMLVWKSEIKLKFNFKLIIFLKKNIKLIIYKCIWQYPAKNSLGNIPFISNPLILVLQLILPYRESHQVPERFVF